MPFYVFELLLTFLEHWRLVDGVARVANMLRWSWRQVGGSYGLVANNLATSLTGKLRRNGCLVKFLVKFDLYNGINVRVHLKS